MEGVGVDKIVGGYIADSYPFLSLLLLLLLLLLPPPTYLNIADIHHRVEGG